MKRPDRFHHDPSRPSSMNRQGGRSEIAPRERVRSDDGRVRMGSRKMYAKRWVNRQQNIVTNAENYRSGVMSWVAPVRAMVKPVSEGLFAGMLNFGKLSFNWDTLMLRLTIALGIFPRGDHRDWNAVHAWAEGLNPILV